MIKAFFRKLFRIPDPSLASFIQLKYGYPSSDNFDDELEWVKSLPGEALTMIYQELYSVGWIATKDPHYEQMVVLICMHVGKPYGDEIIRQKLMEYHS